MLVVNLKSSQILPKLTNWRSQLNYYVDDSYIKGLKKCTFGTIITGESGGVKAPVISYAGHVGATYNDIADAPVTLDPAKTVGLIYETSPQDPYRRLDDFTDVDRLFPKGARTDKKYALMPYGVLEITDTDEFLGNPAYFRTVDEDVITDDNRATDVVSFDDATATIVLNGDYTTVLRTEDKLEINGDFYWIESIVYDDGADTTEIVVNETGIGDIPANITVKSQLFEPAYLADDMAGELPFTMIPSPGREKVGFVESFIALRFNVLNTMF